MKKYNLFISANIFFLFLTYISYAGNFTWDGSSSTAWTDSSNWTTTGTPGVPSTNDTVTIVTNTNQPLLAATTTIKKFTMTSGTLDCNSYTLTISATATFNGGTINNGTVTCSGTSTLTFAGTIFGAAVNATGNNILFSGSVFNSTLTAVKKGTSSDNGNGGNVFNGAVSITDSSSGYLVLSNNSSSPDTFNAALTVASRSSGSIYLAHQGTNNVFNGKVTMYSSSSGRIYSNYYGTAYYNDSIVVNSTSSGGVYFGMSTGSCTVANNKTISIGTEGFDHTASGGTFGTLYFHNFNQSNATAINLTLTGSRATIKFEPGCLFYGNVTVSAPGIFFDGCRFLGKVSATYTTGSGYTLGSVGGNYFGDSVTVIQGNAANVSMGVSAVDTFATYAHLQNTATGFSINNALFLGDVKFKNALTNNQTEHYWVASTGSVTIKGTATIENANSTTLFGSSGGNTVLDTNSTLSITSGSGKVQLWNVVKYGTNSTSISMSGSGDMLYLNTGNVFNGPFYFSGQRIFLNGSTFNGTVNILRTSATTDACDGGNVFNGTTTVICDSVNTTNNNRSFQLATVNPDDFNGDVTFKQYGSGIGGSTVRLYPAYTKNSTFAGNITVDGNSAIEFGANGGKVILDGNSTQTLSKSGSYIPSFKRIQINKSAGIVSLSYPLTLADTLFLTKGVIKTDTTNMLIVPDNGIVSGGSDLAYVSGPLKKIGNDAFTFALGDTTEHTTPYHPFSITAPSSTSDEFSAQYFALGSMAVDTTDSVHFAGCENWTLKHNTGSSKVKVSLGWNANSCWVADTGRMVVEVNNGSLWTSHGKATISKSENTGTITTLDSVSIPSSSKYSLMIYNNVGPCGSFYQIPSPLTGAVTSTGVLADYGLQYGFTSTVVWIGQDFIIDGSHGNPNEVIFENCQVRSEQLKEIQVSAGQTLKVKNFSTLTNCTDLWGGVRLTDVSSKIQIEGASIIENAIVGVSTSVGGIVESDGVSTSPNIFNDNLVDIHIEGSSAGSYAGYIRGTDFTSTFTTSYVTNTAIEIVNSKKVTIGDDDQSNYTNHFTGFNINGISSIASDLCAQNCEFNPLHSAPFYGIYAKGSFNAPSDPYRTLNVGTAGFTNTTTTNSKCWFTNLHFGISSFLDIKSTILLNTMDHISGTGIRCQRNRSVIDIEKNSIITAGYGIDLEQNPFATSLINDNFVKGILTLGEMRAITGIKVFEPGTAHRTKIIGNKIFDFTGGIDVWSNISGSITDNSISFDHNIYTFSQFDWYVGIQLTASGMFDIIGNTVTNQSNSKPELNGIRVYTSNSPYLCSNHTTNFRKGIIMNTPMFGSHLKLNTMDLNTYGFVLDQGGDIGEQGDYLGNQTSGNVWSGNSGFDTYSANNSNPWPHQSFFDVLSPITTGSAGATALNNLLVTDNTPPTCGGAGWNLNAQARSAIFALDSDTVSTDEQIWFRKHSLYEWLLADTSIDLSDTIISAFIDTVYNEPIGIQNRINTLIAAAYVDTLEFPVDDLMDSAQTLNNTIDTTFHINKNIRKVNAIYFNVFAPLIDTLTVADSTYLVALAKTCLSYEGPAVSQAIAMLEITGDTTVYRGDTLCPSDTCTAIAAPDSIEGYLSGVCGSRGMSYSITPVTGATSYKWTVSDTLLATVVSPDNLSSVSIDFSDSVSVVMLTAQAKSTCASSSRSILIYGGPLSPGIISGSDAVCSGGVEEYTLGGSHGATYYEWTVPSGSTILGGQGTGSIIVLFGSTSGYITANASNDCDTSDADSLSVTVNSCRQAQEVHQLNGMRAYPNPTTGAITIRFYSEEIVEYSLTLSDITGNNIMKIDGETIEGINFSEISCSGFAKGIYFLSFKTPSESEFIRIVIE